MDQKLYQQAVRYATKLIRDWNAAYSPRDLVHDAYIKSKSDEFLIRCVKLVFYEKLREKYQSVGYKGGKDGYKGEIIQKVYKYLDDENELFELEDNLNPEEILLYKESKTEFDKTISSFDKKVLDLKLEGYKNQEIEEILERSNPIITKSIKNIKERMHTHSPFNGCKVKVIKQVKRKTFEAHPELLEQFEMGDKSDYNEYYTLMTSKQNPLEGLLIREEEPKTLFM